MIEMDMHNLKQPLSVNIFSDCAEPTSDEIFLEVLIHRFSWLRALKKNVIERMFSALGV
jgi:hypothetical protein